jgi:hypothetical protein
MDDKTVQEWRHKADQYDSVVEALRVADGGRYRADTLDAVICRLRRTYDAMEEASRCIQDENPRHALQVLRDAMHGAPQRPSADRPNTAIAPFARLYEAARGLVGDEWVVGRVNDATGTVFEVTMGDLRELVGEGK